VSKGAASLKFFEIAAIFAKHTTQGPEPMSSSNRLSPQSGIALLIALIVLSMFSLLGFYMMLNATTELQISDNRESHIQAECAARTGINHARVLVQGLAFDDLLVGPDGVYNSDLSYLAQAKTFAFRNPIPIVTARLLNIVDPFPDVRELPDDGIINTGCYNGSSGTVLIPITGIALGDISTGNADSVTSRYFVKVTDNNGEATEVAGDPADNPFADGDGIVIVRSIGIAGSLSGGMGTVQRSNSMVILESRLKRALALDLGPALVVEGPALDAFFEGGYEIAGGIYPAVGVIDTVSDDEWSPEQIMRAAAGSGENISGGGLPPPSIQRILFHAEEREKLKLMDPLYLWDFIYNRVVDAADQVFNGDQNWTEGRMPYAGTYDSSKPASAPGQDPRVIVIKGDLSVQGDFSGGGLLVVTGSLVYQGNFAYDGLIMLVGAGRLVAAGSGQGIRGSIFVANLSNKGGQMTFGIPAISITDHTRIVSNRDSVRMALSLIPPLQISLREIAGRDP